MIELRTFGTLDLRRPDGAELRQLLAQPKRLGVLCYLALATPRGFHRRDKLAALFWPESDQEHARTSLRKAIHGLRQSLGGTTLPSRGDEEVGLDFKALWCDGVAFEEFIAAERFDDALDLYRGDLLEGFFLESGAEFERWLDVTRGRLRGMAAQAARLLAEREESDHRITRSIGWARRAVDLSDNDERAVRRLIEVLVRSGDRHSAFLVYKSFSGRLLEDYNTEPSPETRALLESLATAVGNRAAVPRSPPDCPVVPGYAIERELGRGAMATVYLARDIKHARRVAIKILRPELAAVMGSRRFLREIAVTARLNHRNILPLLDSGEADGLLYFTTPYMEGESLEQLINREGVLPLDEALRIVREVAQALESAHAHDVLHCDIKPANILLHEGHAVVCDFGIARAVSEAGSEVSATSRIVIGTPSYMSPEQAKGELTLDRRTDVYSLGCVLYEMLTGSPPFNGASPQVATVPKVAAASLKLADFKGIPHSIATTIGMALATSPADRPATARSFAQALFATRGPRRMRAPAIRGVVAVAMALAILSGIALTGRLGLVGSREGPSRRAANPTLAVLPFTFAGSDPREEYIAHGMHEEITSNLAMIGELTVITRSSVLSFGSSGESDERIASKLGAAFLLRGSVSKHAGTIRLAMTLRDARQNREIWSETYRRDQAAGLTVIRSDVARRVADALQVRISGVERARLSGRFTQSDTAYSLYLRAINFPYESDQAANVAAADLLNRAVRLDSGFSGAVAELAYVYFARVFFLGESRAWSDSAMALANLAIKLAPDQPGGYHPLALSHVGDGRLTLAWEVYSKILELRPSDAGALQVLGWVEYLRGRIAEAQKLWLDAHAVDPMNSMVLINLNALERLFSNFTRAGQLQAAARALTPENQLSIGARVRLLIDEGRIDEAVKAAEDFLLSHPRSALAHETAADASLREGDYNRARMHYENLHSIAPNHWNQWGLTYRTSYGFVLLKLDQEKQAREVLEQARVDGLRLIAEGDERPGIRREIAAIHAGKGDHERALEWFERAIESGWRQERNRPSPLFESLRNDARFKRLLRRIAADLALANARLERQGLRPLNIP